LKASVDWLQKAAASDSDDVSEIADIAAALQHWEELARKGEISSSDLHERYRALDGRVQRLLEKRDKAASADH
jgi:hypothetical protein